MAGPIAFGRYVLLDQLATGGMAEIFLARDTLAQGAHSVCVIKRVLSNLDSNPDFIQMFLDEARIAARLHHPGIVQILELGQLDHEYYLAMEYLAGEDSAALLEARRRLGRLPPVSAALQIASLAADALHHAHGLTDEAGQPLHVVHRDVSPSNIFLTYQGGVKLLDFGIARAEQRLFETRVGQIKGKAGYMSPEQARGDAVDARADVWSLGVCLYELLTVQNLFTRSSWAETILAVREGEIPSIAARRPDVPAALDAVIARALERDLNRRLPSAAEFRDELAPILASLPPAQLGQLLRETFGDQRADARLQVSSLLDALPAERVDTESIILPAEFGRSRAQDRDTSDTPVRTDPHRITDVVGDAHEVALGSLPPTDSEQVALEATDADLTFHDTPVASDDSDAGTPTPSSGRVPGEPLDPEHPDTQPVAVSLALRANTPNTQVRERESAASMRRWMWGGAAAGLFTAAVTAWGLGLLHGPQKALPARPVLTVHLPPPPPPPPKVELEAPPPPVVTPPPAARVEPPAERGQAPRTAEEAAEDVVIPPDFHPGERPRTKPSKSRDPPPAPPSPAAGWLTLDANEPMNVTVDGAAIGTVPLKHYRLPVGDHRVRLENHFLGLSRQLKLAFKAGEEQNQYVTFLKGRLNVSSSPWADVFIDGRKLGTTPLAAREVWEGRHVVRLVGPQSEKTVTVDVVAGQTAVIKERLP
jgi:serine/threonine protein kinase